MDNIHAEFNRLKAVGVHFKAEKPIAIAAGVNKGGHTIYFTDPDGITLELLQPPLNKFISTTFRIGTKKRANYLWTCIHAEKGF